MNIIPALYLIPVNLSKAPLADVLPSGNTAVISELHHFIVENVRSARRFLKQCNKDIDIDSLTFYELNRHTDRGRISEYLSPLRKGVPVGVLSEAGCPAIADPGSDVVAIAQKEGLKVVPLVGPSSILLSLMGSGFNGQGFAFHGYLPIDAKQRQAALKKLEREAIQKDMTQIFIETPYRNQKMLDEIVHSLRPETLVCIARDITDRELECIITKPASQWRNTKLELDKHPAIFLIYHS